MRTWITFCSLTFIIASCGDSDPPRGKAGESCERRADCGSGLSCLSSTCTASPVLAGAEDDGGTTGSTDDGGTTTTTTSGPNTSFGGRGETCRVAQDCEKGLICVPVGASGLGRCDVENYGFTPTGMSCGAECKTAADCCELPIGLAVGLDGITSCAALKVIIGSSPETCTETSGDLGRACFLFKTYCDCGNAWECKGGSCSYGRSCDTIAPDIVMRSCPTQTRAGRGVSSCNVDTKRCEPAAQMGCTSDTSCNGKTTADTAEICKTGECTCVTDTAQCYRRCNGELDCQYGFRCDGTKKVCVPANTCETDAQCARIVGDVTAKCVSGACKVPCETDRQCSDSGLPEKGRFNSQVCSKGYCTSLGCSSDTECSTVSGGSVLKMFCATPVVSTVPIYRSAITD